MLERAADDLGHLVEWTTLETVDQERDPGVGAGGGGHLQHRWGRPDVEAQLDVVEAVCLRGEPQCRLVDRADPLDDHAAQSAVAHTSRASTVFPETSQHSPSATGGDQPPSSRRTDGSNRPSPPSGQDGGTRRARCQADSTVVGGPWRASAGGRGSTMRRGLGVGRGRGLPYSEVLHRGGGGDRGHPHAVPMEAGRVQRRQHLLAVDRHGRRGPSTRTSSRWKAPRLSPCRVSASTVSWPSSRRSRPT